MHNKILILLFLTSVMPASLLASNAAAAAAPKVPAQIAATVLFTSHFDTDAKVKENHEFTDSEKQDIANHIAVFKIDSAKSTVPLIESMLKALRDYREKLEKTYVKLTAKNASWFSVQITECSAIEKNLVTGLRQKRLGTSPNAPKRTTRSAAMSATKMLQRAQRKADEATAVWKLAYAETAKKEAGHREQIDKLSEQLTKLNLAKNQAEEIALKKKKELEELQLEALTKLQEAQKIAAAQAALAKLEEEKINKIKAELAQAERKAAEQLAKIQEETRTATALRDTQAMLLDSTVQSINGLLAAKQKFDEEENSPEPEQRDPNGAIAAPTPSTGDDPAKNNCSIQ